MNGHAAEVWKHAPGILEKLEEVIRLPKAEGKQQLLAFLGIAGPTEVVSVDETKPGVEDYEFALHSAALDRLETEEDEKVEEVAQMLDITAAIVVELFQQAAQPGVPQAETDRCKNWWSMLLTVAEDVSKLIPLRFLERFVRDWEESLLELRAAYLKLALQRLSEFDARQEAEQKVQEEGERASREAAGEPKDAKERKAKEAKEAKEAKDREAKRTEDRKKMIAALQISPNGQLYLTLTSLLKQLCSRLCGSLHTPLRARIVLLLEQLLAMDHKAIANNQKLRTQDLVQASELDTEPEALLPSAEKGGEAAAPAEAAGTEAAEAADATAAEAPSSAPAAETPSGQKAKVAPSRMVAPGLSKDPAMDAELYRKFWSLQEYLHMPEKLFEKEETWGTFHKSLSDLLTLFLKYPVQDDCQQPWSQPEAAPLRHAPRARALPVQLEDPAFRLQFLTQVMIAFQALEQDGSSRRADGGGIISRQPELQRSEFLGLKKVCEMVLSQTRKGYPAMLKHLLERESHWVLWKMYGCREFERESLEMLNARISPADRLREEGAPLKQGRPQLPSYLTGMLKTLKDPQWKLPKPGDETARPTRLHTMRDMCDTYLDRLIEEDKPENQVDEEYKAKRNKVFMWQARRLFCQQHLRVFAQRELSGKTDFMDFVKTVKGPPIDLTGLAGADAPEDGAVPGGAAGGEEQEEGAEAPAAEAAAEAGAGADPEPGDALAEPSSKGVGAEAEAEAEVEAEAEAEAEAEVEAEVDAAPQGSEAMVDEGEAPEAEPAASSPAQESGPAANAEAEAGEMEEGDGPSTRKRMGVEAEVEEASENAAKKLKT